MFGSKATVKHTKITREFGPDGKVVKEVIETTADPEEASKAATEAIKDTEEFAKEFEGMHKRVSDFFGEINSIFGKFWGRK